MVSSFTWIIDVFHCNINHLQQSRLNTENWSGSLLEGIACLEINNCVLSNMVHKIELTVKTPKDCSFTKRILTRAIPHKWYAL